MSDDALPSTRTPSSDQPPLGGLQSDIDEPFGESDIQELYKYGRSVTFERGTFGELSLALWRGQEVVAVKTYFQPFVRRGQLRTDVQHEIRALRVLQPHPNIIKLLALYPSQSRRDSVSLGFEYCPADLALSLQWRRKRQGGQHLLPLNVIRTIAGDIYRGLSHCHAQGFVHRDVKPANLLVTIGGWVQLCDFGIARPPGPIECAYYEALGTLWYRAPEILLDPHTAVHPSMDTYSAGLVVAELIAGRVLLPGNNELDQLSRIFQALGTPTPSHWPEAVPRTTNFLQFVPMPPRSWEDLVPRTTEGKPCFCALLQKSCALDPMQRHWDQRDWVVNDGTSACRAAMVTELIPHEWEPPVILSDLAVHRHDDHDDDDKNNYKSHCHRDDNNTGAIAVRQVLGLVSQRKTLLTSLERWNRGRPVDSETNQVSFIETHQN